MNKYKIGDKVTVINHFCKELIGMKGEVFALRKKLETNLEKEIGQIVQQYQIRALNWGRYMKSKSGGEKKVFSWTPDNILSVSDDNIELT